MTKVSSNDFQNNSKKCKHFTWIENETSSTRAECRYQEEEINILKILLNTLELR